MKNRYRLFRRGNVYWSHDSSNGKQESLRTKDRTEAQRLLNARNEALRQPGINLQIARAYLMVSDPQAPVRTWQHVMDEIVKMKTGDTKHRWNTATKDKALDDIRKTKLLETRAEQFLSALQRGKISTNVYLRRLQNFALALNWLPVPVIPVKQWPVIRYKEKRAITLSEHRAIASAEGNPERKAFYELAWYLGASQTDLAFLHAENIDWANRVITYSRCKTREVAMVRFADEVAELLKSRPDSGPLFPYLRTVRSCDRATEFKQRCQQLGIKGVTLHSYRYAWAERAKRHGYPERFAQLALGHNSKAVHRAYARNADVVIPTLESYEKPELQPKIIPIAQAQ